jgi:protein MpaA
MPKTSSITRLSRAARKTSKSGSELMRRVFTALMVAALLGVSGANVAGAASSERIGVTAQGTPIRATVIGDPDAPIRIVVLGQMHGNEPAGRRVVRALRTATPPPGTAVWLVPSMNPDGHANRTRANGRGVDLNRNFPTSWRQIGRGTQQWSGPSAASEAETQAMMEFLAKVQPTAVLSFHQPFGVVDLTHQPARAAGRLLAEWMNLPARIVGCSGPCRGTLTEWATQELNTIAITIEFPSRVQQSEVEQAADAVVRLARWLKQNTPDAD